MQLSLPESTEKFINKIIETQTKNILSFAMDNNIDINNRYILTREHLLTIYYETIQQNKNIKKKKRLILKNKCLVIKKKRKLVLKNEPVLTDQKIYVYFRDICKYLNLKYYYYETILWSGPAVILETAKYDKDKIEQIKQKIKTDTVTDIINQNLICIRPKISETPSSIKYRRIFSSKNIDNNNNIGLELTEWDLNNTTFYLDNTTDNVYTYDNILLIGKRHYVSGTGWAIIKT
jgi:hypothetical protein